MGDAGLAMETFIASMLGMDSLFGFSLFSCLLDGVKRGKCIFWTGEGYCIIKWTV